MPGICQSLPPILLEHNLLDFSLQLELFWNTLWRTPECHGYLTRQYRQLIYDNMEEDIPVGHDLLSEWLPDFDSALLIYDEDGGYRRFLGPTRILPCGWMGYATAMPSEPIFR